jgi:hypothetical protein
MEGTAWEARQSPPARVSARTAQQPGLILAAAWVGGMVVGCPWLFFGGHRSAACGVRACEHGASGWGMARGVRSPWFEARALMCAFRCVGALGATQALRAGWSPGVVHRPEGLSRAGESGQCSCRHTTAPRRPPPESPLVKG